MATRARKSAADFIPEHKSFSAMRDCVESCRGCDLYKDATHGVFGEGPGRAEVVLVGEQPGDAEDRAGKPFVGSSGRLLDRALVEAGIDRGTVYVTNAVKHFRFKSIGKRRLHQKPSVGQINACRPWLDEELKKIRPKFIVCLGATAALGVFGKAIKVTDFRGKFLASRWSDQTLVTVHPSSVLRAPDAKSREVAYRAFVSDLMQLADRLDLKRVLKSA